MEKNIVKGILLGGIALCLFSCKSESSVSSVDKEQIKKEIQAKETEFAETYNSGELKNIGYYADDATSFYQNRPPLIGKAEITAFLKSGLSTNSNKISFTTKEVFPSSDGNQVVEIGYFKVTDSANNVLNTGNYMSLFQKKDGKYVSVRDMSASDGSVQ